MITLANISIQYGGRILFDNITVTITQKDRVGLVGKNGAGKSTLLKVLVKQLIPDNGTISMDNKTTLGYLPQEIAMNPTKTVYEETLDAFAEVKEIERQIGVATVELESMTNYESPDYMKHIECLTTLQDQFQRLGGMNMREDVEKILKGLGFINGDFDRLLSEFSGGWQMRVELAKILLRRPDFILLDEPTNHLDIESIMWLENFLAGYEGGVALISHDRAFLDHVTNRTVELVNGKAYDYKSSYSQFVELRQKRIEKQRIEAKRQEKFVQHTEQLINKFRAKKNKAKFAQTLMTKLDRLEKVEVDDKETGSIQFRFPEAPRSGLEVVKMDGLSKNYGATNVINNIDFVLERGEKIAFIGKNGEGKTTLAKVIVGREDYTGHFKLGHNVSIGYYEQHQAETLDGNQTVLQVIDDAATGEMRHKVRSLLGAFLFSGEDVDKKVQVLSGGEKSRLAIAKLLLEPVNLLILDEPTNHLDMQSKEILKQALVTYTGSMIIVSHDREFLKGLTDKVYEFKNKKIKSHFGDVYAFLEQHKLKSLEDLNLGNRAAANAVARKTAQEQKQQRVASRQQIRELDKAVKREANRVKKSERRISELETKIGELEKTMGAGDFYTNHPNPDGVLAEYQQAKADLEAEMERWEELAMQLEEAEEERGKYEG